MRRLAALLGSLVVLGCTTVPGSERPISAGLQVLRRGARRLARENRALRHGVRSLRRELRAMNAANLRQTEERRSERVEQARAATEQARIASALTSQIETLASTIERLERILRAESPVAQLGKRDRPFEKVRLGSVPAATPTPPPPREDMDSPAEWGRAPDLLNPFSKAGQP